MHDFKVRLMKAKVAASEARETRAAQWATARMLIQDAFSDATSVFEDLIARESNGDSCYLQRGADKLDFSLDGKTGKVLRVSTRKELSGEYETINGGNIQDEVEDFVTEVYSRPRR